MKTLTTELRAFYITNLIAKFPKLSFLLQNLRNPISLIRMFFGMREALKDQQPTMPVIDIGH